MKSKILENICYTDLVYGRINKKLGENLSRKAIEEKLFDIIERTDEIFFMKRGKNIYISNEKNNIRVTINLYTYRVITVDRLKKGD